MLSVWRRFTDLVGCVIGRPSPTATTGGAITSDEIHIHLPAPPDWAFILEALHRQQRVLRRIHDLLSTQGETMADTNQAISELQAEVEANRDATSAVSTVITTLVDQLEANADDPEQIRALAAEVRASTETLTESALKGTPADPTSGGGTEGGTEPGQPPEGQVVPPEGTPPGIEGEQPSQPWEQ